MNHRFLSLLLIAFLLVSCTDEKQRAAEQQKDAQKKEKVFASISKHWKLNTVPGNPAAQSLIANWAEWRNLMTEMSQQPKSSIGAFQKKANALSDKARLLDSHIPPQYDKPEIRSRIAVLTTKINSLNLFINLDDIPADKVNGIIDGINTDLRSFESQLDEIVRKSTIPKEQGESDMIKMLDTARAIPTNPEKPSLQSPPVMPRGFMAHPNKSVPAH